MVRWLAWIVLGLVAEVAVAAGPTCAIEAGSDSYFGSRTRSVRFPDGRTLTVLGLNHGNRDLRGGIADQLARVRTSADIARILAADPSALADSSEAVRYLRSAVRSDSAGAGSIRAVALGERPMFVAAEASPATVATNLKSYAAIRTKIRKLTGADDAMTMGFGADFYLKLKSEIRTLIGVEDAALGEAYLRSLPALTRETEKLAQAKFDPDVAAKMNDFVASLVGRYATLNDKDDLLREARAKFSAQDYAKLESFLKARIAVMRAMRARDRHDVAQLLAQKSSGILLIGSSHLDSIAQLLHENCVELQNSHR